MDSWLNGRIHVLPSWFPALVRMFVRWVCFLYVTPALAVKIAFTEGLVPGLLHYGGARDDWEMGAVLKVEVQTALAARS